LHRLGKDWLVLELFPNILGTTILKRNSENTKTMIKDLLQNPLSITHLEADINYTVFHLLGGKKTVSSYTLKHFEELLRLQNSNFMRIHRGYMVNLSHIISKTESDVTLIGDVVIPVSRRRRFRTL